MILSTEQMRIVNHGLPSQNAWEWVDLPVGPQSLPKWAKGLHVDWMLGYANSPRLHLKTNADLRCWPDKRFENEGSRYMARTADGRAEVYYHSGPVSMVTMRRPKRRLGRWSKDKKRFTMEPCEWEDYQALATTPQEGFGGAHVTCQMGGKGPLRGKTVTLRGPWHGGAPPGYVEIAYINTHDPSERNYMRWNARRGWGWERLTGRGGLFLREDVFIRIFARFLPHCRLARCTWGRITTLDAVHPAWPAPKQFLTVEQRQAAA